MYLLGTRHAENGHVYQVVDVVKYNGYLACVRKMVHKNGKLYAGGDPDPTHARDVAIMTEEYKNHFRKSDRHSANFVYEKHWNTTEECWKQHSEGVVFADGDIEEVETLCKETLDMLRLNAHLKDQLCELALTTSQTNIDVYTPNTHKQAMKSNHAQQWLIVEDAELKSMHVNNVMEPAVLPSGVKPLHTRWVYRNKLDKEGNIKSHKVRLVVKGYEQIYGIDYDETYSPVARLTSIRLALALSAKMGMLVHQMDVDTAFLNADLNETVYIVPPDGMPVPAG